MKKIIDFSAWYADRKRIEAECEEQEVCASEFKKLVGAQTEEDWVEIIQRNFEWVHEYNINDIKKIVKYVRNFREGFAPVKDSSSGLWGFMKTDGTMLTDFEFYDVWNFRKGFTIVQKVKDGVCGWVNSRGEYI